MSIPKSSLAAMVHCLTIPKFLQTACTQHDARHLLIWERTWECEMMGVASVLECTALRSSSTKRRTTANSSSTYAAVNSLQGLHM